MITVKSCIYLNIIRYFSKFNDSKIDTHFYSKDLNFKF